ncbi:MAG TPA: universal stress protein [Chloroflexota bacterium]|nr:universal stress protein [Chloroflexota bacterium]
MPQGTSLVVAVEDFSTAGIVAVEGAHVASTTGATDLVLLHVLDPHHLSGAALAARGFPVAETEDVGETLLDLAEQAMRAEFTGMGKPVPRIRRRVCEGNVWAAIQHLVDEEGAVGVVMGARRPHAFGILLHPDVHSHLAKQLTCPIYVASLQAGPEPRKT